MNLLILLILVHCKIKQQILNLTAMLFCLGKLIQELEAFLIHQTALYLHVKLHAAQIHYAQAHHLIQLI